jgi:uncharacterized repeat protein (TIGR03803 family)
LTHVRWKIDWVWAPAETAWRKRAQRHRSEKKRCMRNSGHHGSWTSRLCQRAANAVLVFSVVLAPLLVATQSVPAQTFTVLYSFKGGRDGAYPMSGLVRDGRGNLYGTTSAGGASNNGTVFKLDATGTEAVLYSFCMRTNCADGALPVAGLLRDKVGNLYGTASGGGTSGNGVVFKLDASGKETVLRRFAGDPKDGAYPQAGLIQDAAGNLYGTTTNGGSFGDGIVFKLDKAGKETVLYHFTGGVDGGDPQYGRLVRDPAGNLYGTTYTGGSFSCGGDGCGTVFKLNKAGKETVFHNFSSQQDGQPFAGLIRDPAGNLYGTTAFGGPAQNGVVFKLDSTGAETILHSFTGGSDGGFPYGGLLRDAAGNLYGSTNAGGPSGWGVVFKLDATDTETVLYSFTGGTDGGSPYGDLIQDGAGNLYGTTNVGGASNFGVVFKLQP